MTEEHRELPRHECVDAAELGGRDFPLPLGGPPLPSEAAPLAHQGTEARGVDLTPDRNVEPDHRQQQALQQEEIPCCRIGTAVPADQGIKLLCNGDLTDLPLFPQDEVTRVFAD